jgi:hypothetical protein
MAALASKVLNPATNTSDIPNPAVNIYHARESGIPSTELVSMALLDVVHACLHRSASEWIFLRELRVGTGFNGNAAQRLDAFALNCLPHTSMKRVCYEVKTSRADFLCEMRQPLKRRIGLRYSNEFYFVTAAGLVHVAEVPVECGLVEIGTFADEERNSSLLQSRMFVHFDPDHQTYCRVTVPAPWRETPGPTWQLVAGMLRNQQKAFQGRLPKPPNQQRLPFLD